MSERKSSKASVPAAVPNAAFSEAAWLKVERALGISLTDWRRENFREVVRGVVDSYRLRRGWSEAARQGLSPAEALRAAATAVEDAGQKVATLSIHAIDSVPVLDGLEWWTRQVNALLSLHTMLQVATLKASERPGKKRDADLRGAVEALAEVYEFVTRKPLTRSKNRGAAIPFVTQALQMVDDTITEGRVEPLVREMLVARKAAVQGVVVHPTANSRKKSRPN